MASSKKLNDAESVVSTARFKRRRYGCRVQMASSQCRPQSPRAQTKHLPKNGDEERKEEIQNQANVIILGLGDSVSDLQANLNLFPQKSQLFFSPRSRHSSHQHPSSYSLFSPPLSIIFFTCSNSEFDSDLWIFILVNCVVAEGYWLKQSSMSPYAGMLFPFFFSNIFFLSDLRTAVNLFLFRRFDVSRFSVVTFTDWATHC